VFLLFVGAYQDRGYIVIYLCLEGIEILTGTMMGNSHHWAMWLWVASIGTPLQWGGSVRAGFCHHWCRDGYVQSFVVDKFEFLRPRALLLYYHARFWDYGSMNDNRIVHWILDLTKCETMLIYRLFGSNRCWSFPNYSRSQFIIISTMTA
jgi:hypothetical protein